MGKLHELLAIEETVVQAAEKLLAETAEKFNKHSEYFVGYIRTLKRLNDSAEDKAIETAQRRSKELPTNVKLTLDYILPIVAKSLNTKLQKHATNQIAMADIELDDKVLMKDVPVDFLLDLEKQLPRYRQLFASMPTIDPSRKWEVERDGVFKSQAADTTQGEKVLYPVVLSEATDKHPAQVKEASKEIVVGIFSQVDFTGAATSQQKADALALCDNLLIAVKAARMRANSVVISQPKDSALKITGLFSAVFK